MSEDCSTCKYNEINEQDLPCRECLNSFCGVPFNSPTKYELADKNTMSLREEIAALRATVTELKIVRNTYNNLNSKLSEELRTANTQLAEKEREIAAIRELMNCYNIGGWTDSTEPMKRALQAEAELAEERHENEHLIALRDEYEELVGNVALILGCTDEWSNCHDHRRCIVENATEITHKLAELRERLKPVEEYKKHEFCKDVKCTALEYNTCSPVICHKTAKHFHRWLEQNGYKIIKVASIV